MPTAGPRTTDQLVGRLFESTLATMDVFALYLGHKLGYYQALAEGPLSPGELAGKTGTDTRYAREWLEQQAVSGFLDVTHGTGEDGFALPTEYIDVLANEESLAYVLPLAQIAAAVIGIAPALVEAYRTGGGVPWEVYGEDGREAQAAQNRPMFLQQLASEYLPIVPGLADRLRDGSARVADIGCGHGWSSIGIAEGFPAVTVDGFDLDGESVRRATAIAEGRGLGSRVRFHERDAGTVEAAGEYDLVCAFECIHDMPDPVGALSAMRRLAARDGTVLIMDERVADTFDPETADDVERLMYGFSISCCLPAGRADPPANGCGTVLRRPVLERLAREAGFTGVEVLPIENDFFRFYLLRLPDGG